MTTRRKVTLPAMMPICNPQQMVRLSFVERCAAELTLLLPVTASIEEYIKIVAAGMVGTTPHMISATITALSRLIFEFQGECELVQGQRRLTDVMQITFRVKPWTTCSKRLLCSWRPKIEKS